MIGSGIPAAGTGLNSAACFGAQRLALSSLLMRQPYGARIASTVVYAHPSWYAQQGYLVLVLDVRGRGDSGGDFSGFAAEAADGDDALTWLKAHPL